MLDEKILENIILENWTINELIDLIKNADSKDIVANVIREHLKTRITDSVRVHIAPNVATDYIQSVIGSNATITDSDNNGTIISVPYSADILSVLTAISKAVDSKDISIVCDDALFEDVFLMNAPKYKDQEHIELIGTDEEKEKASVIRLKVIDTIIFLNSLFKDGMDHNIFGDDMPFDPVVRTNGWLDKFRQRTSAREIIEWFEFALDCDNSFSDVTKIMLAVRAWDKATI